jgi:hypothetical protein
MDNQYALHLTEKAKLIDHIEYQKQDGNWNYDGYSHGAVNGLIEAGKILFGDGFYDYIGEPEDGYISDECTCDCDCNPLEPYTFIDRMFQEKEEIEQRCMRLYAFIISDEFKSTSDRYQSLCRDQLDAMEHLLYILSERLDEVKDKE